MRAPLVRSAAACAVFWLTFVSSSFAGTLPPGQPLASFFFPNDLLTWSPATDPDAPYNRSAVVRANRFLEPATQVNSNARPNEGRIAAVSVMFPTTSNNPAQGGYSFDSYTFGYWQYIDILVFFGGSAGEGLILAPNPGITDAAHRNGVLVLGNVFFPPNVFGGNIQWVQDMVQRVGGSFPVADKMIELAEHYGFDGWFINQETSGGNTALATDMRDFIRYLHDNSDLHIQWYDSMIESGGIAYQNALNSANDAFFYESMATVSDTMFLNYNWSSPGLTSSANLASSFGRTPYDVYAGVNVGNNGFNTPVNWNGLWPNGVPHKMSLAFFATQWTQQLAASPQDYYNRANRFWVGQNGDPSDTTTPLAWKGLAHYVPAFSAIDQLPFLTNFNTGQGNRYAIAGEVLREGDWHNRGLQDVLPTWRWLVDTTSATPLEPSLDFDDPYDGGTSLQIAGSLDAETEIDLYKTQLVLPASASLSITYKTGTAATPTRMEVGLTRLDPAEGALFPTDYLAVPDTATDGWNTHVFDLTPFAGETIAKLSLRIDDDVPVPAYDIRVGQLAVYDGTVDTPLPPTALVIEDKQEIDPQTATLRLRWDDSVDPTYVYNVYRRNPDDSLTYLGGTANNAFFVPAVERVGFENTTTIEVEAVGLEYGHSTRATTTFDWDQAFLFIDGFESGDTTAWSFAVGL